MQGRAASWQSMPCAHWMHHMNLAAFDLAQYESAQLQVPLVAGVTLPETDLHHLHQIS